jgi:4'-phosphopantetheinyl transferase
MLNGNLQVTAGEVHVWHTTFASDAGTAPELWRVLSEDEQQRADRFSPSLHRRRFVAARVFLRSVLAKYLDIEPASIRFTYTSKGRPELKDNTDLVFSVSHSDDLGVIAVARNRMLGIDVEMIRNNLDIPGLSRRFFADAEWQRIRDAPLHEQDRLFFSLWTCKEAFLKARGLGLNGSLNDFAINFSPTRGECAVQIFDQSNCTQWSIRELNFDKHAASAIAVEGEIHNLRCTPWIG